MGERKPVRIGGKRPKDLVNVEEVLALVNFAINNYEQIRKEQVWYRRLYRWVRRT